MQLIRRTNGGFGFFVLAALYQCSLISLKRWNELQNSVRLVGCVAMMGVAVTALSSCCPSSISSSVGDCSAVSLIAEWWGRLCEVDQGGVIVIVNTHGTEL